MSMTPNRRSPLAAAISLALLAGAPAVNAQNATIEEVVVTAQKREQNLQQTPIAVSALNANAIDRMDIRDVSDLNGMVPNLRLSSSPGNANGATINIRGAVTINPALTMEPTVGIYLDGIYIGKNTGGVFDVADLERIEVLRGPQGSLYGKNTLGGAINLVTKKPSGEFGGEIRTTLGSDNLRSVKTTIDAPAIGEVGQGLGRISTKIAYVQTQRDGFWENEDLGLPGASPVSNEQFGNVNSKGGRFAVLWEPSDVVSVGYSYDMSHVDQNPQYFQMTRAAPFPGLEFLAPFASDKRQNSGSMDQSFKDDARVDGHGLTITWDAGTLGALGDVTFKSLTGKRHIEALDQLDWDATPYPLLYTSRDVDYSSLSQEFQMVGKTERLNYVAGVYFFEEEGRTLNPLVLTLYGSDPIFNRNELDNDAWAVFAQFDWNPAILDDRLTLTLGLRHTEEDKSIEKTFVYNGFTVIDGQQFDKSYKNFSPSFTAAFQATDDVNVYFRVAEGWKAGVFNAESSDVAELASPIDEETVTSYELGMKSQWLDNRLQANIAAFYNQHKDMQISRFNQASAQSSFTNAGEADVKGIEIELVMVPVENLQINASYGYLDAEYSEYMDECRLTPSGANPCGGGVLPGDMYDAKNANAFPYSPENTGNIGIQYTLPLFVGELVSRVDWTYTDSHVIYPDPYNNEFTAIDSYELVDARISWEKLPVGQNAEFAVSAWGKNLGDEKYRVNGIEWGTHTTMLYGNPRTFGVDMTLRF